jgi:hypothetical protein
MVVVGAAAGGLLAFVWALGAPLLIRPVFSWSDLRFPTANAGWPLLTASNEFAAAVAAATFVLFTIRYVLIPTRAGADATDLPQGRAGVRSLVFGVAVPIILFSSVVTQPVDAVVLVVAVLAARPVSSLVLRRAGLARPLAIIPRPVRLIIGFGLSAAAGYLIVKVLGTSTLSSFFSMVVAMAVGFVLTRIMLDADDFVASAQPAPSLSTAVIASLLGGLGVWLLSAGFVLADNIAGQTDGWGTAAAAGAAAAGAGGLAAASANKNKNTTKPNPPPWYIPNFSAPFFGYDAPKPPPPEKKKDPTKAPDNWPKQRQSGDWDK